MKPLITNGQIKHYVSKISRKIEKENPNKIDNIVFICLLKGGYMFFNDLTRNVKLNIQVDFMHVSSYQEQNQGDINILKDITLDIKGKHVYVVDDFYDTGNTLNKVMGLLEQRGPSLLKAVTFLKRKTSPESTYPLIYGMEINDEWVYGYGMDKVDEYGRNLSEIFVLK